jgi:hypothetical protein
VPLRGSNVPLRESDVPLRGSDLFGFKSDTKVLKTKSVSRWEIYKKNLW